MVSAVICEYNPFHNGHKYQLEQMKKDSDAVICIMSGDFVQRGDVSVYDKFIRAKAAMISGADLVIMLPVIYSLSSAELFAFGGVALADSLGIVDSLYFGSECGNTDELTNAAKSLLFEPSDVSENIQKYLADGISYPSARAKAFSAYIAPGLITEPNNILAIEYIKAIMRLESKIKPVTVTRHVVGHHDTKPSDGLASATAIRRLISDKNDFSKYVPCDVYELFKSAKTANAKELYPVLAYILRTKTSRELSEINEVTEGLENRLKASVYKCAGFSKIAEFVKSKRYTQSKINRILFSILLNIDKSMPRTMPEYIRVLGMNKKGMLLLSDIKRNTSLPIITKTADYKGLCTSFETDILASDLYTVCQSRPCFGHDYITPPIIMK